MTSSSSINQVVLFKNAIKHIFDSLASSSEEDSWKKIFCNMARFASKISGIPFDPTVVESPDRMIEFGERCLKANSSAISCLVYANKLKDH
ncbi:MAG: hypothetical protein ACETWM_12595 [Candidatus Lokiarchaeia archaeon]